MRSGIAVSGILASLCQQKVEKTIPTYVQGTVIPEMSDFMKRSRESARMGMLFKFHGSFEYWFMGCVSSVGIALGGGASELNEQRTTISYLP